MSKFNYEVVAFDPNDFNVNVRYEDSYGTSKIMQVDLPLLDSNWETSVHELIVAQYPYLDLLRENIAETQIAIPQSQIDSFVGSTVADADYAYRDRDEYVGAEEEFAVSLRTVLDQTSDLGIVWCDSTDNSVYSIPFTNQIMVQNLKKTIGSRSDTDKVLVTDMNDAVVYADFLVHKPGPTLVPMTNDQLGNITNRLINFQEFSDSASSAAARIHQNARQTFDDDAVLEALAEWQITGNSVAAVAQAVYYKARNADVFSTVEENYAHIEDYMRTTVHDAVGVWDWSKMRFNASARHSGFNEVVAPSTTAYPGAGVNSVFGIIEGELVGGAAFDSANDCLSMSGDGQFMSAFANALNPSNGFSVGVWYDASSTTNASIVHLSDAAESTHHGVLELNGSNFYAGVGSADITATGAATGKTHALVTYNGDRVSLYVNGVKKGSATGVTNTIDDDDVVLKIGGLTDNSYTGLTGNTVGEMDGKVYRVTAHVDALDSDQAVAFYTAENGLLGQHF